VKYLAASICAVLNNQQMEFCIPLGGVTMRELDVFATPGLCSIKK